MTLLFPIIFLKAPFDFAHKCNVKIQKIKIFVAKLAMVGERISVIIMGSTPKFYGIVYKLNY